MSALVSDIIKWTRRLIKLPNDQDISDTTVLEYLNRFYVYDVPYRIQQFELKTQYSFETQPNVDQYNLPIDTYNSVLVPVFVDGFQIPMTQSNQQFNNMFQSVFFNTQSDTGDGTNTYSFTLSQTPFVRAHIDVLGNINAGIYITSVDNNGDNVVISDNGVASSNIGQLVQDTAPNTSIGTVNYLTGAVSFSLNGIVIPSGNAINTQTTPYVSGRPSCMLFYNNVFTLRAVPDKAYLVKMDAYLTPSEFLSRSASLVFGWMGDYLAHGTARRILKDFGDVDQLQTLEPFFQEQERQVLRRTGRQNTNMRTSTIFQGQTQIYGNYN